MRSRAQLLLFALVMLLSHRIAGATPTPGATPSPGATSLQAEEEAIAVDAESISYDQKNDSITATGKVVIRRGGTELRADRVELRRNSGEANARGGVSLTDPEGAMFADQMEFNLNDETGAIEKGQIRLKRNHYSLWGERIEKGRGQTFRIQDGKFTTCDCDDGPPDWSFSGKGVDVDAQGYGTITGGTFNVLDVPVFYIPKALVPILRERQSGLLIPTVGFSNRRGFQLVAPVFLAIDRSQDASLAFDLESSARIGLLGQYRYAIDEGTGGELNGSWFNEFLSAAGKRAEINPEIEDQSIPDNRWSVVGNHRQALPYDTVGYADAFIVSDDSFLRDMNVLTPDRSVGDFNRTRRYVQSRAGAATDLDHTLLRLQGDYYQAFTQPQALTLQKVPELRAVDQRQIAGGLLEASTNMSASSWVRESGIDGFRFDLWPRLRLPIRTGLPFYASAFVGARETAYSLLQNQMRGGLNPESTGQWVLALPSQSSREMIEGGGEIGTEVARIYDVSIGDLQRLKHTIEPLVSYWYVPAINQDELPVFDDVDRMEKRHLLSYGLVSRLFGRFETSGDGTQAEAVEPTPGVRQSDSGVRELARLSLQQAYDPSRIIAPVGQPSGSTAGDHLSDIDLYFRASPVEAVAFNWYSSYDTSANDLSAASASLRLTDTRTAPGKGRLDNRSSMTVNYRFITRNLLQQVDGFALVRITDYIGALGGLRYDVQNSSLLESRFGLRFLSTCDCWGLDITFVDKSNPNEIEVRALLTLVGFGAAGR